MTQASQIGTLRSLLSQGRPAASLLAKRGGQAISFAEFEAQAAAWRTAAEALAGPRVALFIEDSFDFAAALFGLWHAGKQVVLPADVLPLTLARLAHTVDAFAGEFPAQPAVPRLQIQAGSSAPVKPWAELDEQAQLLQIFTSGSTAEPCAIPKRLGQLFDEVLGLEQAFGQALLSCEVCATVSHQHIYGLLFRVLWPLASGRVFQAQRLAFVEALAEALQVGSAAAGPVLIASPAHLKRLPAVDLRGLRRVFSSGGPLPETALPECQQVFGQAPVEVYGSSETGGVAWRQRDTQDLRQGLAWHALPGVSWRLQRDAESGEELLAISSPHLPDSAWTLTQDKAAPDPNDAQQFVLLGRADRILKIEEKRVSLHALEAQLMASGWIQELRVLSLPGPRQQLAVIAQLNEAGWAVHDSAGRKALAERLRARLLQGLEAVVAPRRWRFVSALPLNTQGKATQAQLLALFDPRRPASVRTLKAQADEVELGLIVDASLPQFDGHFPGAPVLPGVAQLEWAIRFGREFFSMPAQFQALEVLKFQQVISPGMSVRLSLAYKAETSTGGGRLSFKFESSKGLHASGRVVFGVTA